MGTLGHQTMTLDMACLSQNFVTPEINFGHLAPQPWGSAEAGTKVGDATQDPPDPAAPRCAPEPELTASNAYNNLWETNAIQWYPFLQEDKDWTFRFGMAVPCG